jgi:hypothetical protein
MKCIAQISHGKVLKSNGTYKELSKLQKGDRVLNMYGKPIKVLNLIERRNDKNVGIVTIKHDNFFKNFTCTEHQEILTWNDRYKKAEWVLADYFRDDDSQHVILPTTFSWDLPESFKYQILGDTILTPSFDLGFLFGVYMRVGYITYTKETVRFHCDTLSVQIIEDVINISKRLFNTKVQKVQEPDRFISHIDFENNIMYDIFTEFGEDSAKHLPNKYYCTDKEYVLGLNMGIMYAGSNGNPPLRNLEKVHETLYWSSLVSKKPLSYGQLIKKYKNIEFLTGRTALYSYNRGLDSIWTLDVDCPTGTYIVNNLIVRSD